MNIRIFVGSAGRGGHARYKRLALRGFYEGIRRENVDTALVTKSVYEPCYVALLFGTVGPDLDNSGRRGFRREVLAIHKGPLVLLEGRQK